MNVPQKIKIKSENEKNKTIARITPSASKIDLRNKLMSKYKITQEQELERQKNRLKKVKSGGILGSALKGENYRSPSINSISSDDSILSDTQQKKKRKKKKKKHKGSSDSSSSSSEQGTYFNTIKLSFN